MDFAKIIFIGVSGTLFFMVPLFLHNRKRYFLALASFLYIFSAGWIFYHYNGLMLADLPIFGLLVTGILSPRRFHWKLPYVGSPVVIFILWCVITSFFALQGGWALSEMTKFLRMYLLMVAIYNNVDSMEDLRTVLFAMLSGLVLESLIGIYQWRFGALGIWFLGERPGFRIRWRTMGTFFVPSFYANYLGMMLPVVYRMFLYYKAPKLKRTLFYGFAFGTGFLAFFTTYGRAPWIAFVAAVTILTGFSLLRNRFKSRIQWTFPVMVIMIAAFSIRYTPKVVSQFGTTRQGSYEVRFPQFRIAQRMMKANPVTGVGLGNYQAVVWDYMTETEKADNMAGVYALMVHNAYFLVTAELGFLGGLIFIWWLLSLVISSLKLLWAKMTHSLIVNLTMGILGGTMVIIVVFTFSPDVHAYQLLYQLGLFGGILSAEHKLVKRADFKRKQLEYRKKKEWMEKRNQHMNKGESV